MPRAAPRAPRRPARAGWRRSRGKCGRRRRTLRERHDLVALLGDGDRVLPLRGEAVVLRHDGPAVGELTDAGLAGVDHRLDREGHARLKRQSGPRLAVVQDLRLLMEFPADAVAAELAHHREALSFGVRLDRRADVAQAGAGPYRADAEPHAFEGRVDQALCLD